MSIRALIRVVAVLSWIAVSSSCGGDGGGSSPTEPGPPVSIQGTWVGTATSLSASGTCLATDFQGITVPARWVIQQSGASFTGTQTLNNIITCPFRGTINGSTVTFFADPAGPSFCAGGNRTCRSGSTVRRVRTELRMDRAIQTATVTGNRMSASGTSVARVFDAVTNESLGDFEVRGTQTLDRQ